MQQHDSELDDGSPGATLYRHYAPVIIAYLLRELASREEAEDLLLEVFLAALQRRDFFTFSQKDQQAWLWKVARNKVADHYRDFSRHPTQTLSEETIDENDASIPERAALKRERYTQLHACLRELPEPQREVVVLRYGNRLSCAEIAAVLGKSEAAVRMLLSRTLKLLRTTYSTQEESRK